jgi:hypothetical protein
MHHGQFSINTRMKLSQLHEVDKHALDAKTPTVLDLAKKYGKPIPEVQTQLKAGVKIELEHTTDKAVAREIALDHLGEDLDYYEKLKEVED